MLTILVINYFPLSNSRVLLACIHCDVGLYMFFALFFLFYAEDIYIKGPSKIIHVDGWAWK
jgi:hypothetical protein